MTALPTEAQELRRALIMLDPQDLRRFIRLTEELGCRYNKAAIELESARTLLLRSEASLATVSQERDRLREALIAMQDALKYDLTNASKTELAEKSRAALAPSPTEGPRYPEMGTTTLEQFWAEPTPPPEKTPVCRGCGAVINAGEAQCFGCCDDCWDKAYPPAAPPEKTYTRENGALLKAAHAARDILVHYFDEEFHDVTCDFLKSGEECSCAVQTIRDLDRALSTLSETAKGVDRG